MEEHETSPHSPLRTQGFSLALYGLIVLGWWAPGHLWGIHYPAFLPLAWGLALLGVAGIFMLLPGPNFTKLLRLAPSWNPVFTLAVVAGMCFLFWFFPLVMDPYGDASFLVPEYPWVHPEVQEDHVEKALSMNFLDPKTGTSTVVGMIYTLSAFFQVSIQQVWSLLDLVAGALFVWLWLRFIQRAQLPRETSVMAGLMGLTAPWLLVFFGHFEVYAFVYLFQLLFWDALSALKDRRSVGRVGWLILVFLLNLKFHVTGWLLFPALVVSMKRQEWTWTQLVKRVVLPFYLLGTGVYFYVTQSAYASRQYSPEDLLSGVFLPLSTVDGPPMDRYDLFSAFHLLDMGNLILSWSLPACLVVAE